MLTIFKRYRCVVVMLFFMNAPVCMYSQIVWATAAGQAWLTATNWTGNIVPSATDIAQFGIAPTSGVTGVGINMNAVTNNGLNNQAVGAIEILNTRSANIKIGNSSAAVPGTLTLNGALVNGIADVVLRNNSPGTFTIDNRQALGASTMRIELNDAADNKIYIGNSGNIFINTIISGLGQKLSLHGIGTGILQLNAANTYSGTTLVAGAQLQLNATTGNTLPPVNDVVIENSGSLRISTNQILNNISLDAGGALLLDPGVTLTVNGTFFNNGGTISGAGIIAYGPGAALHYGAAAPQITTDAAFPAAAGPRNVIISNASGVALHAARNIAGQLNLLSGNFILGANNFTAGAVSGAATINTHIVTNGTGKLGIKNIGSTPVVFPVGANSASVNPVIISNGNGVDYAVRVEQGFTVAIADPLKAVNRTWIIQAATTPNAIVDVSFWYSSGDGNASFSYMSTVDHGIYLPMGFGWNINQAGLPQLGSYHADTKISSFLGATDLPMVLGNLGAILHNDFSVWLYAQEHLGNALLQWDNTASSLISTVDIERSADGMQFNSIAKAVASVKRITDTTMPDGISFYRIKTNLTNGTVRYSNTEKLFKQSAGFKLYSVWPSIVQNKTQLYLYTHKKILLSIVLIDTWGRRMYQKFYALSAGNNAISIDCEGLPAGIYNLAGFTDGLQVLLHSIIKQ
ncbi:MAG: hypothetical protein WCI49_12565 [Ferruginibacter sp.]